MNGSWDAPELDEFFARLLRSGAASDVQPFTLAWLVLSAKFFNRQSIARSKHVGEQHYELR